jgi:hypothetical protein
VVVERRTELGPIICLDDLDDKGQAFEHEVDELDGGLLVEL